MRAWVNGEIVPLEDASVSVLDHGLTVGNGVFETLRVYGGEPFAWTRHFARLCVSAEALGIEVPSSDALRAAAGAVIGANDFGEARLRITVTDGPAPPGSARGGGPPTTIVVVFPVDPYPPTTDVVIVPWTRNERGALAGLKTISYGGNVRALAYASARGAGEAIFANTQGNLCEATGSNVFLVRDGTVVTPPASAGCLLGVTRALVLECCAALGIPAEELDVPIDALARADEAFLSSTTREAQPIAHVDGVPLTAPGPVTLRVAGAFRELVTRDIDP